MKKVVVTFVSAAALATAGMAAAANSTVAYENGSSTNAAGVFVSGNLGYGVAGYKKSDFIPAPATLDTGNFAWNANVGYQFNQYVAVEGGYTHVADVRGTLPPAKSTITVGGFNAAVKGILPINNQFDLFAKAGAMDIYERARTTGSNAPHKVTEHAWTPELGVGTSYNINSNVALSLQDVYTFRARFKKFGATGHIPYTNTILAGVSYKFNV